MDVAVLGLGVMGHGMAAQLLAHGHNVTVFNRSPDRAADLSAAGAHVAETPRLAVEEAEIVVLMVADDGAIRAICEGEEGVLAGLRPGTALLQMSTISPDATDWLYREVQSRRSTMLDAPVMGSLPEAIEGRLWVLAGGEQQTIDRARPALEAISQAVYHVGEVGHGTRIKLCLNLLGGGMVAALAEALVLSNAVGIDEQQFIKILDETNMPARLMLGKARQMAGGDFAPRFSLDNMAKDVALAVSLARSQGLHFRQGEATLANLRRSAELVGGDRDTAALQAGAKERA